MAITPMTFMRLVNPGVLGTSDAVLYTVPAGKTVSALELRFCNTTGSAVQVYWSILPSATAAGAHLNDQISGNSVAAHDSLDDSTNQVLNPGDKIAAYASATGVVLTVSGRVIG